MGVNKVLLTRRAVVQAGMEPAYGQAVALGNDDGVLVSEPTYEIDANVLERDFTRDSLSQTPHIMGRKLAKMTFSTELRGNGKQHSGNAADAAIITRLFRMCGYGLTAYDAPHVKGVFDVDDHASRVSWVADVADADNTDAHAYYIEVVVGGPLTRTAKDRARPRLSLLPARSLLLICRKMVRLSP
jgi:hypothetical protein